MDQQQRTRWALSLAAGVLILIVVVVALVSRGPATAPPAEQLDRPEAAKAAPPVAEAPPGPAPALRRADLVAAAVRAAAAYAAGQPSPAEDRKLVGRPFEVVIPFGCAGPSAGPSLDPARWNFDLANKTITLSAQPQLWTATPWVRELVGAENLDRIEGFWIPRPWLAAETCPAPRTPAPGAPVTAPSESSVGLVRTFAADASRVGRRDERPYQVVRKASEDQLATTAHEYRLVLSGRVSGFGDGAPVRCYADNIDRRPACLIAVEIDRVAFVEPATGEVLADWRD